MSNYITIDGGTTNTRLNLVISEKIVDNVKFSIGARVGAENRNEYKATIKKGIEELLGKNNLSSNEVQAIICSGMITSEGGLINLPHLVAPVGILKLAQNLYQTELPDISAIPFVFIRGVKHVTENEMDTDMMRGEETELYGLFDDPPADSIYILPGSHSKLIKTDEKGRITSFSTSLSGEMIAALSEGTILKGSLNIKESEINEEYLKKGCIYASENGLSSALFKVRILDKGLSKSRDEVYSFFLGAILCPEYNNILRFNEKTVVISGRASLRKAFYLLLQGSGKKILEIDEESADNAASKGALRIYKERFR